MKNRITELFSKKKEKILSIYFTADYPALHDTLKIAALLENSGADMIEIGIPFSDPMADGPVIQKSSHKAIENGMTVELLFVQLKDIRNKINIPVILMGYLNPIYQFGIEKFIECCGETGIDGVIIPDLPPEMYAEKYSIIFEANNLSNIFLVTPQTQEPRLKYIDSISNGFIYLVSSASTTGSPVAFETQNYQRIKSVHLKNPLMIGFGISDKQSFEKASESSSGVIIGSAFIKNISKGNLDEQIPLFISSILN